MDHSRAPSESPATSPALRTAFSQDGRTSPAAHNNAASRLLPRSAKQYFHPGCTLCSLIASLPSEESALEDENSIDGSGYNQAGPSRPPHPRSESEQYLSPTRHETQARTHSRGTEGRVTVAGREVVYFDDDITIYVASGKERMCEEGKHLIVVLNKHVEKVYDLSPADVPALSQMLDTAQRLLSSYASADVERGRKGLDFRIGFVGSMIRDPYSPQAHLHAHAMIGPLDTSAPGCSFYRRNVIFGSLNWWSLQDLRAEIREESSNNRVKSGYEGRQDAPIDQVPDAGSFQGLPNAIEPAPYSDTSPSHSTRPSHSRLPASPQAQSPTLKRGKGKMVEEQLRIDQNGLPHDDTAGEYQAVNL